MCYAAVYDSHSGVFVLALRGKWDYTVGQMLARRPEFNTYALRQRRDVITLWIFFSLFVSSAPPLLSRGHLRKHWWRFGCLETRLAQRELLCSDSCGSCDLIWPGVNSTIAIFPKNVFIVFVHNEASFKGCSIFYLFFYFLATKEDIFKCNNIQIGVTVSNTGLMLFTGIIQYEKCMFYWIVFIYSLFWRDQFILQLSSARDDFSYRVDVSQVY